MYLKSMSFCCSPSKLEIHSKPNVIFNSINKKKSFNLRHPIILKSHKVEITHQGKALNNISIINVIFKVKYMIWKWKKEVQY